jgi:ketosteroid isomerase-like protein
MKKYLLACSILYAAVVSAETIPHVSQSTVTVTAPKVDPEVLEIVKVLTDQQTAWNEGNLEGYMNGYWKNDSLLFIGKKGITAGWQQTLDNYKRSYPDKDAMGLLGFEIMNVEMLSSTSAHVIGKWQLTRDAEQGNLSGYFTLVFRKIKNRWVIVSDHSS